MLSANEQKYETPRKQTDECTKLLRERGARAALPTCGRRALSERRGLPCGRRQSGGHCWRRFTLRSNLLSFVRHDWKRERSTRKTGCAPSRSVWQSSHRGSRFRARRRTLVASLRLLVRRQVHVVRAVLATLASAQPRDTTLLVADRQCIESRCALRRRAT